MDGQLYDSWDRQRRLREADDDLNLSWEPPSFGALVAAAQATTLSHFYPVTSHWVLWFRTNDSWPGTPADAAPGSIVFSPGGVYEVRSGLAWRDATTIVLATTDPAEAAAALEQLLAAWDQQDPELQLEY